jgi:DNA-binding transcriptional MerR regulator
MADYPIRAAAKLTGIAIDTLRAWERRYKAVQPRRSARGRVYDDADVQRLSLLRRAVENGHAIGQIASLPDGELADLSKAAPVAPSLHASGWLEPLLAAVEALDYPRTNQLLGRVAALLTPTEVVHEVILPAFREVGERWGHGFRSIAREHLLSASVRNLLGTLGRPQTSHSPAHFLFTTPSGELHEFGILVAAILAIASTANVSYLGPNLPVEEIIFAVEQTRANIVVMGLTHSDPAIDGELLSLAEKLPPHVQIWLGGDLVPSPALPARIHLVPDFHDFEQRVQALMSA